jgi:hypothetical protein
VRNLLFLLFSIILSHSIQAQCFSKAKAYSIRKYDKIAKYDEFGKWHIRSKFGHGRISRVEMPEDFLKGDIVSIDYYYTTFKSDPQFKQTKLDSMRFVNLELMYPSVFSKLDSVPVRFIEQTLAQSKKHALFFYHGFVVNYQVHNIPEEKRKEEIVFVNKLFKRGFDADNSPKFGNIREIYGTRPGDILSVWGYKVNLSKPDTTIRSHAKWIRSTVQSYSNKQFVTCFQESYQVASDTILVKMFRVPKRFYPGSAPPPFATGMYDLNKKSYDDSKLRVMAFKSPVFKNEVSGNLLEELNNYESDSVVLVIDATASMFKSIAQVLHWANSSKMKPKIKGLVFFNDGDSTLNKNKEIGNTGGIYYSENFSGVQKALISAMKNGTGGDGVENDIEAVLKARAKFGTGNYILVADNLCKPRDLVLKNKINFPLNILICNGIEAKQFYVDLSKSTGGKIINKAD